MKHKLCLTVITAVLLTGCGGAAYDIMPAGTHDIPEMTIAVPEEFRNVQDTTPVVETTTAVAFNADAERRLASFEKAIQGDFYTEITKVKTVGASTQACELQFTFKGDNGCYKYYTSEGQLTSWVVSDKDGAYLIDDTGKTVYTADHIDLSTREDFINAYKLSDATFVNTAEEDFEGATLLCDTYSAGDTLYKYYYDTSDNLIVIAKQRADALSHTLFKDFRTAEFDETVFAIPDYERQLYVHDTN